MPDNDLPTVEAIATQAAKGATETAVESVTYYLAKAEPDPGDVVSALQEALNRAERWRNFAQAAGL